MTLPQIIFRVLCMDCTSVLLEGDEGAPISHGLCDTCFNIRMAAIDLLVVPVVKPRVA